MTVRSIERLMVRLLWVICLGVIVRWFVIHKLDQYVGRREAQGVSALDHQRHAVGAQRLRSHV